MAVQPADALTHDLAVHEALAAVAAARAAAERAVAAAHEAAERAVAAAVAGGNRPRQD